MQPAEEQSTGQRISGPRGDASQSHVGEGRGPSVIISHGEEEEPFAPSGPSRRRDPSQALRTASRAGDTEGAGFGNTTGQARRRRRSNGGLARIWHRA